MAEIIITNLRPEFFAALARLQRLCYPTLADHELMNVDMFASQYRLFPEGQFVALDGALVVGQGSGLFINFDFEHARHTFKEICANFYFTNHDPNGEYYYGADISVHPDYRGRGVGKLLYQARKDLIRRTNRRGLLAGGMIPGYAAYKGQLTPHEYVARVAAGELSDPTLSFQLKAGFRVRGLLEDYLEDSASDNWATLIEWENPDYVER
jgi:GNAT superfamily N-acetyltransferase